MRIGIIALSLGGCKPFLRVRPAVAVCQSRLGGKLEVQQCPQWPVSDVGPKKAAVVTAQIRSRPYAQARSYVSMPSMRRSADCGSLLTK
jgi:hypothetical protein